MIKAPRPRPTSRTTSRGGKRKKEALGLSPRQRQVVAGVGEGLTYPEIAASLCLRLETVRHYVKLVRRKTGIRRKSLLAVWAREQRIGRA